MITVAEVQESNQGYKSKMERLFKKVRSVFVGASKQRKTVSKSGKPFTHNNFNQEYNVLLLHNPKAMGTSLRHALQMVGPTTHAPPSDWVPVEIWESAIVSLVSDIQFPALSLLSITM